MKKMCRIVNKNLVEIVEGEIGAGLLHNVKGHLKSCPECSSLIERFRHAWQELEKPLELEPSPSFWPRLEQKIKTYEEKKFRFNHVFSAVQRFLRPATVILALLAGTFAGYKLGNVPTSHPEALAQQKTPFIREEFLSFQYLSSLADFPKDSIAGFYLSQEIKEKK
ncbi:MAG: hypothetical protein WCC06_10755 [Candidatus Aminicenantales bacterium]